MGVCSSKAQVSAALSISECEIGVDPGMPVRTLAEIGGILALLTLLHFVADWVFQSHAEAMAKPTNHKVRAKHCLIYTAICCAALALCGSGLPVLAWSAVLLFTSHFLEDTYLPVLVWARYIRKPPEMAGVKLTIRDFQKFAETVLGKILLIAIDQIVHVLFLLPIASMVVQPQRTAVFGLFGIGMTLVLAALCQLGRRVLT